MLQALQPRGLVNFLASPAGEESTRKLVLGYGTMNIRGPRTSRNTGPQTGTGSGLEMPPKPWAPNVGAHTLVYNLGPFSELIIRAQQRDPIGT